MAQTHHLGYPLERRQRCWAHLRRKFVTYNERDESVRDWEAAALGQIDLIVPAVAWAIGWRLAHMAFQTNLASLQRAFHGVWDRGRDVPMEKARGFSRDLLNHGAALWTFVQHKEIDPTNNRAERALRPSVVWHNRCFGTQTKAGLHRLERLLTMQSTCRQQDRDLLVF